MGTEIKTWQIVNGKLSPGVSASVKDRFTVYRLDTNKELDENPKGRFLQKVGIVEVRQALGESLYRFMILKSGDSVQLGDLLKQE